tara:strand:- start:68 stop:658 length:591 start_codon:yes stop_codon:yes gene_type:complete
MIDDFQYHLNILEIKINCDEDELKSSYRLIIKKYHPDKYHNADDEKLQSITKKAIMINDAYTYLKRYIEEHGPILINEDRKNFGDSLDFEINDEEYTTGFPEAEVFEYFVHSSNILSCGYSQKSKVLYLKFRRNYAVYKYHNVDRSVFFNLMEAESHGKYVNKYIAYSYKYEKCKDKNIPYSGPKNILLQDKAISI